ncbi:NUDIX hydrolase [Paenibacillus sp. HJGM_3]|uniref:NUDIX hydrolase n=1 Tax=Paenibacillus sp. HJGM_3 TaxID=3379816 RepID=UPI00385B2CFB
MSQAKFTVSASVIALNENDEILLIRNPFRGWEMPQGLMEEGETIEDCAIREVREETGLEVRLTRFCGVYHNRTRDVVNFTFLASPVGGVLRTSAESLEVGYFPMEQVLRLVTWGNFRERIERVFQLAQEPRHMPEPFLISFYE